MLPADLSPSSCPGLFWKAEAALARAAPRSRARQHLAARGSQGRKGRPLIFPRQQQEDQGLHHMEEQHTHMRTHSQTHTSHPWDHG